MILQSGWYKKKEVVFYILSTCLCLSFPVKRCNCSGLMNEKEWTGNTLSKSCGCGLTEERIYFSFYINLGVKGLRLLRSRRCSKSVLNHDPAGCNVKVILIGLGVKCSPQWQGSSRLRYLELEDVCRDPLYLESLMSDAFVGYSESNPTVGNVCL